MTRIDVTSSAQEGGLEFRHASVILGGALLARLLYGLAVRDDEALFAIHEAAAVHFLEGQGLLVPLQGQPGTSVPLTLYPPGFAVFIASVYWLLGSGIAKVKLVQGLLGSIGCVLLADSVRRGTGYRRVAFWSGIGLGVLPITAVHDVYPNSNASLPIFLLVVAVSIWYRLDAHAHPVKYVWVGVFVGAAATVRTEVIPCILIVAALCLVGRHRQRWTRGAIVLVSGLLVLMPQTVRNYRVHGHFGPSPPGIGIALISVAGKFYPDPDRGMVRGDARILAADGNAYTDLMWPDPYKRDRRRLERFFGFVQEHPFRYAAALAMNVPFAWFAHQLYISRDTLSVQSDILSGTFSILQPQNWLAVLDRFLGGLISVALFSLACAGVWRARDRIHDLLPFICISAYYLAIFVPLGVLGRYTVPAYVFLLPLSVIAIVGLEKPAHHHSPHSL